MVKHTQAICQQIADELFECVWIFFKIGTKRINIILNTASIRNKNNACKKNLWKKYLIVMVILKHFYGYSA